MLRGRQLCLVSNRANPIDRSTRGRIESQRLASVEHSITLCTFRLDYYRPYQLAYYITMAAESSDHDYLFKVRYSDLFDWLEMTFLRCGEGSAIG